MSIKEQHKALFACVFIALTLPANFIWWRFVYDILAFGESNDEQLLVLNMVSLGFFSTCVTLAAYAIGIMVGDK